MSVKRGEVSAFFSTEEVNCTVFLQEFLHFFFFVCVGLHESFLKGLCFDLTILLAGCTLKLKIFTPILFIKGKNGKFNVQ